MWVKKTELGGNLYLEEIIPKMINICLRWLKSSPFSQLALYMSPPSPLSWRWTLITKKWPKRTHLYYNIPGNPWGGHLYWKGYKEQSDQRHKGQLGKLVSSFLHFTIFTKDFQAEATGCYTIGGQVNLSKSRLLMVSFKSSRDYSTDISCFICFLLQYSSDILHVWVRHETDCMPK